MRLRKTISKTKTVEIIQLELQYNPIIRPHVINKLTIRLNLPLEGHYNQIIKQTFQ